MPRRGKGDLSWIALGLRNKIADRMQWRGIRHNQHVGEETDQRHRGEIGQRIVIDRFKEVAVDGQSGRGDVHGVAVGSGAGDELGGDIAAGAGLVLDDHLLAPDLREPRADDAADAVDAAAGREGHDELDDAAGPALCCVCGGGASAEDQHS
jgi:hypothetical protein